MQHVVINEAVRTLLYLPLYDALDRGFFRGQKLQVDIVTGGTATNCFAAMLRGDAALCQADPMYVPISRAKHSDTRVVAQVVSRIAVWGLAKDPNLSWTQASVRGKRIATQLRPMTAYVYALKAIKDIGLDPAKDVEVIESQPGTELVPLFAGRADYSFTLEPNTSKAVDQGAHVVLSYPTLLGDQIFTGLMATEAYLSDRHHRDTIARVVRAYQQALDHIHDNPAEAAFSAAKFFPQLDRSVIEQAVKRMVDEGVIPRTVAVSNDSWNRAVLVRVMAGDLARATSREENCDLGIMEQAAMKGR